MEIPTKQDRIQSLYGEEIAKYSEILNAAILESRDTEDGRGYPYIHARMNEDYAWIDSEVVKYLAEHYRKAGWIVEQHSMAGYDDRHEIRIYYLRAGEE